MTDRGYALDMSSPVRHVATELDKVAPAALSVSDLAATYSHVISGDIARVKRHNNLQTDTEATAWLIDQAIAALRRYVVTEGHGRECLVRFADGVTFDDLRFERRKLHRHIDEHVLLGDPFNPMSGWASETIRAPVTASKRTKEEIEADEELRESMRLKYGWRPEFPAIQDERGVVLSGRRRVRIAREEGIQPVIRTVTLGSGDVADAERMALGLTSNVGVLPLSKADRRLIAESLQVDEWTIEKIAELINAAKKSVRNDSRPRSSRAKLRPKEGLKPGQVTIPKWTNSSPEEDASVSAAAKKLNMTTATFRGAAAARIAEGILNGEREVLNLLSGQS